MNVTPWPMNTLSSIVTPSQTKEWLDILQRLPILAFFCTSTNAPILVSSPISQPYRLINLDSLTSLPSFTSGATQRYESLSIAYYLAVVHFVDTCTNARHAQKSALPSLNSPT